MDNFDNGYDVATGNGQNLPASLDQQAQEEWLNGFIWAMSNGADIDVIAALELCVHDKELLAQLITRHLSQQARV